VILHRYKSLTSCNSGNFKKWVDFVVENSSLLDGADGMSGNRLGEEPKDMAGTFG
jgi:hypothetical protein